MHKILRIFSMGEYSAAKGEWLIQEYKSTTSMWYILGNANVDIK